MSQFHFDPDSYLAMMREDLPRYDELQETVAAATAGLEVRRILELGTGTGETARRLLTCTQARSSWRSTRARQCSRSPK